MMYVLLATGFTGAWTLLFVWRWLRRKLGHLFAVAVFFSPKGGCTEAVVTEIKRARKEILVLAYSFTSKPIAEALVEAKKRGVHVDIVLDRSQEKEAYSELPMIEEHGLYPHIDAQHAIAHNKVMIIDKRTLITGSFNFTHQAEAENGENLLIIKGHGELIGQYRQNFSLHKSHSQAPAQKPAQPAQKKAA
jgi:phosphatidylserine/phosphatidylglycerophosphate/cardiolipin synthase-like enzyme